MHLEIVFVVELDNVKVERITIGPVVKLCLFLNFYIFIGLCSSFGVDRTFLNLFVEFSVVGTVLKFSFIFPRIKNAIYSEIVILVTITIN